MENKVLQKNLEIISNYDSELANKILMLDNQKANLQLAKTSMDEYNLVFNGYPLHSQEGALNEVKNIISSIKNKENKNAIRLVYGLGLGYLLDELSNEISDSKIIVYEPNIDILNFVFSIAQIDALEKNNVLLCSDKEMLYKHVLQNSNEDTEITITFLTSYKDLFYDDILKILETSQKAKAQHYANKNTIIKKAHLAIYNTFRNLKNILTNPNITDIKDIYEGKTAICLSAGPSLKENIEVIKENQDKFVIFAVNPTIKLLVQNGIKPDFIVNIEPCNTSLQFSTIETKEYYFILEGFSNYLVSELETKKTFNYISNNNFINPWLKDCLKLNDYLETIGTVSYSALMSAFMLGFKKIIVCGQDLAYKDGNCYAKGSQLGELECIFDDDLQKYVIKPKDYEKYVLAFKADGYSLELAQTIAKNHLEFMNSNLYTVKSQMGENIPTQTGYALFIDHFEKLAKEMKRAKPDLELINSSTGGALINGFENKDLRDVVSTLEKVEKLNLDNYQAKIDKKHVQEKFKEMSDKITDFLRLFEEANSIARKIINEIENKKTITSNMQKMLEKYKVLISKIIDKKNEKDFYYVAISYIYSFIDTIKEENFSDIDKMRDTFLQLCEKFDGIILVLKDYIFRLSDCESVVL